MAITIEYRAGIFFIVNGPVAERATFPKDAQLQSAPPLMGFDYATGDFIPLAATPDGKLKIDGVYRGKYTTADRDAIFTWQEPDLIYNLDAHVYQYWDGLGWQTI
jgi:hypothetical protein